MNELLIIGYGNTLRGDDGAGPFVAAQLRELGCHAIAAHQLTPEMAEAVSHAARVIFVDASAAVAPGETRFERIRAAHARVHHYATPQAILGLARDLFGREPRAWLVSLGAGDFAVSEQLSDPVRGAALRVAAVLTRVASSAPGVVSCVPPA